MIPSLFSLDGRVAIVTGASAGLGHRFATTLADAGATVVVCARRLEPLTALAAEHPAVHAVRCDVAEAEQRQALVDETLRRFGRIDVLVNNAGISSGGPDAQLDADVFARVVRVNLEAAFALTVLVGTSMRERGAGSVVNVSSMFGRVAVSPVSDAGYAASKAGLDGLTRELGAQWAAAGVRVNAIAPGWFPTDMNGGLMEDERAARWLQRTCPMGRVGAPHELDGALLFLAGDASSYCTGQTLVIDGGWTLR